MNKAATRGMRAKLLLEDELLVEAFDAIRADYLNKLVATNEAQSDARDKLYLGVRVLDEVRAHLNTVVQNGVVAVSDLKSLAEVAKREKRLGIF